MLFILNLILLLLSFLPAQAMDFKTLRYLVKARTKEPRIYIPERVLADESFDILVLAPGAKHISLFGSENCNGTSNYKNISLNLGNGYALISEKEFDIPTEDQLDSDFSLRYPMNFPQNFLGKKYCFDAVVKYQKGDQVEYAPASYYGSGAYFTNSNVVAINKETKDSRGAASYVKSLIPGLNNASSTGY